MHRSTQAGLELSQRQFDRFNRELVTQIEPHLEQLELTDCLLKFTGDGWLLMTHDAAEVSAMCCLAIVMMKRFREEMAVRTSLPVARIPDLCIAVCSGQDSRIQLPNGCYDFVGDSARRATRVSCKRNTIIIDEPVRYCIMRDFDTSPTNFLDQPSENQPKRMEEDFAVHELGSIKTEATQDLEAPGCFVYMLNTIGRRQDANDLAEKVSETLCDNAKDAYPKEEDTYSEIIRRLNSLLASTPTYSLASKIVQNMRNSQLNLDVITYNILINKAPDDRETESLVQQMRSEGITPNVITYTTLISKATDYDETRSLIEQMRSEGITPDVFTYNTLIAKATDYNETRSLIEQMRGESITPDIITYNTLISKATDYNETRSLIEQMRGEGITPNVITYNTLIAKATDYNEAKSLIEQMRSEGITPNVATYCTVFRKSLAGRSADEIVEWYIAQESDSDEPIQTAIASFRRAGNIDEALNLSLKYPHLPAAEKTIRRYEKQK